MSWRYVKAARDHRIWPTLVNWLVTSIKTSEAMQSQTIPKETFIIVIFGGMIRRYDSGYDSGYDSWVWFAELELPTLTKICTPEKKTQPYQCFQWTKKITHQVATENYSKRKWFIALTLVCLKIKYPQVLCLIIIFTIEMSTWGEGPQFSNKPNIMTYCWLVVSQHISTISQQLHIFQWRNKRFGGGSKP